MAHHKKAGEIWMKKYKLPSLTLDSKCEIEGREFTARELCVATKINPEAPGAIQLAYSTLTSGGAKIVWLC